MWVNFLLTPCLMYNPVALLVFVVLGTSEWFSSGCFCSLKDGISSSHGYVGSSIACLWSSVGCVRSSSTVFIHPVVVLLLQKQWCLLPRVCLWSFSGEFGPLWPQFILHWQRRSSGPVLVPLEAMFHSPVAVFGSSGAGLIFHMCICSARSSVDLFWFALTTLAVFHPGMALYSFAYYHWPTSGC